MEEFRPDPDELLASLISEEEKSRRGKLKIFFGMCAGVGKTFAMLQTAQAEKKKGLDILIGIIETHNRKETLELVEGLETIPRKEYEYKGTRLQEMDLDAILERKPHTVLVDELAHTNVPGTRHSKRFLDVKEILENGINVYTTLNVQHLESRSETVAQITGIPVRETVPDAIFENSHEVELVDLTPEELLQRLSEGKVYAPERSREAVENFFRKGNITALREMALRIVADRVDKQLHDYMQDKRIRGPWKSGLHLLVAIDFRQQSTRLLRWAKNLSYSMGAQLQALYVETNYNLTQREREQLDKNIRLAKQLGIPVRINTHQDVVKAIVDFAQKENITHIIVGKPRIRNLISMWRLGIFLNKLIRYSGNIDVYILGSDNQAKDHFRRKVNIPSFSSGFKHYLVVSLFVFLTSAVCFLLQDFIGYQSVSFILLFLVSILAIFFGTGPILLAAILSGLIWDYFFIPPFFTLHIEDTLDILMLGMFFIIALLNGVLTSRVRRQESKIRIREERTNALYQLTKELSAAGNNKEVTHISAVSITKYFNLEPVIFVKNEFNHLERLTPNEDTCPMTENETSKVDWVFRHSLKAGRFTETLPMDAYSYFPLKGNSGTIGVVAVKLTHIFTHGEDLFWEACLAQISGKYERELLRNAARKTYLAVESEKLYQTLFNSISHELRIPVATIMGSSETLIAQSYPEETKQKLYKEINSASIRLNRLIENLLNMSRLESGLITPRYDWCDVHDLANSVGESLKAELSAFKFTVIIPPNMPFISLDFGLMEQVLHNLVLNATQHAPAGSRIRLKFFYDKDHLTIQVMDRGNGFAPEELASVFNKFYRCKNSPSGGTGLGLSIVKGFVEAHRGSITAQNRQNGGALFTIILPVAISDMSSIKSTAPFDEPKPHSDN
ncbi:MAG: sensor histidine kinase KdpD [Bacteroidales bacterium]